MGWSQVIGSIFKKKFFMCGINWFGMIVEAFQLFEPSNYLIYIFACLKKEKRYIIL